jgi:hypothetical protein
MPKNNIITKKCRICLKRKPINKYYINKKCIGGHFHECIDCTKLIHKKWSQKNKLERSKKRKQRYTDNKEYEDIRNKIWMLNNSEKWKKYRKKYHIKNKEKENKNSRKWHKNNKAVDKALAANAKAKLKNSPGILTGEMLIKLYHKQKGKCAYCKIELDEKYTPDHIISFDKGGNNRISNIKITCFPCNVKKGTMELGVFLNKQGFL